MRIFNNVEEIKECVGEEIGVSDWFTIDQDRINDFADATGDHQWIHVDPDRTNSELGMPTIAHGFLTLSLVPMLTSKISSIKSVTRGINYGTNKVRFTNMIPVNSNVRAKTKLLEAQPKAGGTQLISEVSIEIEGQDRPAMIAETVSIVFE
ncbi:MAG: enoyl-CoA hydratase [Rhodobiaceae bacterium]|nr:enoyl-CoA hydratase [Rhodobiaceae bacterium]|tara:strand:- start:771 stop:1223 length:453 start_codon:yes stop_codon:yes gene_type:complete